MAREHVRHADDRVMMPMQRRVGRDGDPEHRQLRGPRRVTGVGAAIPRLRRLQKLFHLDLRLVRPQLGGDQPAPQMQKGA